MKTEALHPSKNVGFEQTHAFMPWHEETFRVHDRILNCSEVKTWCCPRNIVNYAIEMFSALVLKFETITSHASTYLQYIRRSSLEVFTETISSKETPSRTVSGDGGSDETLTETFSGLV